MYNSIIILSESASFPWGMAASNRVRNLARALIQQGWQVEYIGLRGADVLKKEGESHSASGEMAGIPYSYPGQIAVRPGNWWLRRVDDCLGWFSVFFLLAGKKLFGKIDVVLLYSRNENIGGFWIRYLHLLKIPVVLEVCEWPLAIAMVQPGKQKKATKFCKHIVPMVDAVLPISSYIEREITAVAKRWGKILPSHKIPILIDVKNNKPGVVPHENTERPYMLYCGSISYLDIAKIVVDIVSELKILGEVLPLVFTGNESEDGFTKLKSYAQVKGVLELMEFTGFIHEEKLHALMQQAVCLLAPLPVNPQSESRFSTKIGYYLASATPVVTNGVGDVDLYLKDGVNAFLAEKCDAKELAAKIVTILENPNNAIKIGEAGCRLAMEKFYFSNACEGLGDFISKVAKGFSK